MPIRTLQSKYKKVENFNFKVSMTMKLLLGYETEDNKRNWIAEPL